MATITVEVDDDIISELEALCASKGIEKAKLVVDLIRQRVERERFNKRMSDPALIAETQRLQAAGLLDVDPNEYADLLAEVQKT